MGCLCAVGRPSHFNSLFLGLTKNFKNPCFQLLPAERTKHRQHISRQKLVTFYNAINVFAATINQRHPELRLVQSEAVFARSENRVNRRLLLV